MKRFSDFAKEEASLDGEKRRLDDVLNREIEVIAARVKESRFKDEGRRRYMTLQFVLEGKKCVLFTGSEVLIHQIEKYQDEVPFTTVVKKIDRYYSFS